MLKVKVVNGQELARLDTTGRITRKYQAGLAASADSCGLISAQDTAPILPHVRTGATLSTSTGPIDEPESGVLMPIQEIFQRLSPLVGLTLIDPGADQERNRGAALQARP